MWFSGREKKGSILGFLLRLYLGKCLARMAFHPKEASKGLRPLVHAIEVSGEVA